MARSLWNLFLAVWLVFWFAAAVLRGDWLAFGFVIGATVLTLAIRAHRHGGAGLS
jgi:hypothetical protein